MAGFMAVIGFALICAWFVFPGPAYTAFLSIFAGSTALAYLREWRSLGPGPKFLGVVPVSLRPACLGLWLCAALTAAVSLALQVRLQPP